MDIHGVGTMDHDSPFFGPVGSNLAGSTQGGGQSGYPLSGFITHAMCDLEIVKLHAHNYLQISTLSELVFQLYKYDGSGNPHNSLGNQTKVGSDLAVSLAFGAWGANNQQTLTPTDWSLSKGDLWSLAIKQENAGSTTRTLWFHGGLTILENWNDRL